MPMFLIYGQRRVGKTSLFKFLPEILGSQFKVVYMDLQAIDNIHE
jgi:AAA+ ATPase superfamily predicted ATPase